MVVVLYIFMYRSNKARDAEQAARGELSEEEEKEAIEKGMLDMTETDNKGFRYIL
jgi:cbb3-type cytochrome oxidase subunit 3